MFRFIHCADLHLDSPLRGLSLPGDAPELVRSATRRALENLVDLCLAEEAAFVLIAGDIFDGDWEDYSTGLFFNRCMSRLRRGGVPVVLIRGNHDAASVITRHLTPPDNVRELPTDRPGTVLLEEWRVAVHGQGFASRSVVDDLARGYPDPVPGYFNIGLLHTSADGREGHEPYAPCQLGELVAKGYDYWALGHIHAQEILHERPHVVFPGNLQGRHIREPGARGCMLVTVEDGAVRAEHRALDVLRWYVCDIDLTGVSAPDELVQRATAAFESLCDANPGYPLAVRVTFRGRTSLHAEMLSDRERFRREAENAAGIAAPDRLWIEKVVYRTEPVAGMSGAPADMHDALSRLRAFIRGAGDDEEFLAGFLAEISSWQARMGDYARRPDALRFAALEDLRALLPDVEALLENLLAGTGAGA